MLATLLFFSFSIFAFEQHPEFESLTESEQAQFDKPDLTRGEYLSDVISFSKPIPWDYLYFSKQKAIDITVGSLSGDAFFINNRAKFEVDLFKKQWQFRFNYFEDRTYERDSVHHVVEVVHWLGESYGISLYGEPSRYKRENDMGFALLYRPSSRHEIRLFNTFVDLVRTERSDRLDRFEPPDEPFARGIVGRWFSDPSDPTAQDFLEYAVRWETFSRWRFPLQQYDYHYSKKLLKISGQKFLNESVSLAGRIQYDQKLEAKDPLNTASAVVKESWLTDRFTGLVQATYINTDFLNRWEHTYGVAGSTRKWLTDSRTATYLDLMPFYGLKIPTSQNPGSNFWDLEYMLTWHRESGEDSLRIKPAEPQKFEHRLNATYELVLENETLLRLSLTFDLDRPEFEGGLAQFRTYF